MEFVDTVSLDYFSPFDIQFLLPQLLYQQLKRLSTCMKQWRMNDINGVQLSESPLVILTEQFKNSSTLSSNLILQIDGQA
jgi:hypothetical protein